MGFNFKLLKDVGDLAGKRVLLRLDLNLPVEGGRVRDDFRLKRSLPTLRHLVERGARTVILAHTDSPETDSLALVAEHLKTFVPLEFSASLSDVPEKLKNLPSGGVLFLENLRRHGGEIANDEGFAKTLASFGELYVNDAFSVSHRAHASIVGVPKFLPSFAGFLLADEVAHLSKAFHPPHPFVFVLAGANKRLTLTSAVSETKFPLVLKFLASADTVFVGGALANDLFRAQGYEIGLSKHSEKDFGFADIARNPKLLLPTSVMTERNGVVSVKDPHLLSADERVRDAGPDTVAALRGVFQGAKFIVWNGTLGEYENGFAEGTEALARAIAESGVEAIVGGGDTLASIAKLNLLDTFSFVSTGGGAMLDFLANETLPGIAALEK